MSLHPQFTVGEPVSLAGVGIHSGQDCRVTLLPSEAGRIVFRRDRQLIPAGAAAVISTARCTTLGAQGAELSTVEHLLAALYALAVTSVEIEVSGPEVPILNGARRV
jgi:UDP-3-O-acyl-N-acetylglucosamine deacetylase